jgi:hypothetical protein
MVCFDVAPQVQPNRRAGAPKAFKTEVGSWSARMRAQCREIAKAGEPIAQLYAFDTETVKGLKGWREEKRSPDGRSTRLSRAKVADRRMGVASHTRIRLSDIVCAYRGHWKRTEGDTTNAHSFYEIRACFKGVDGVNETWFLDSSVDNGTFGRRLNTCDKHSNCRLGRCTIDGNKWLFLIATETIEPHVELLWKYNAEDDDGQSFSTQPCLGAFIHDSTDSDHVNVRCQLRQK